MEHTAITQRPPAYAELLIDSLDRYRTGSPAGLTVTSSSDWQTNFQQIVLNGYFTRLAVTQIQFFWNLPTIITAYNDRVRIAYQQPPAAPVTADLVIPSGWYTPTTLAAAIQAALIAINAAPGFTCTYEVLTGAFRISTAAGWNFGFIAGAAAGAQANAAARFLDTIGMINHSVIGGLAQLDGTPPTMLATRYIDICSATLTKYQRVKDTTTLISPTISNIIARVYPTAPNTRVSVGDLVPTGSGPFVVCIDYNTPKHIKWSPDEALSNFDLQLRDEFGVLIPFNTSILPRAACEYQMTLLASES